MSKLFYMIGASGAGKDSLMNYCRNKLNGQLQVVFAHRYITRPVTADAENHIHLTEQEFQLRLMHGLFALNWQSHGWHYGIGTEIDNWLEKGLTVVINGSREYLPIALQKYPAMQPVLIGADADLIKERLYSRGREDAASIARRIARNDEFNLPQANVIRIDNNAELGTAAQKLLKILVMEKDVNSSLIISRAQP